MSPRAFDTRCAPSMAASRPTAAELACVPAPADVDVAARALRRRRGDARSALQIASAA